MKLQQDLLLYRDGESFRLIGQCDRGEVACNPSASVLIQHAVDELEGSGGELQLASGEYMLEAPIQLRSRITLSGKGRATRISLRGEGHEAAIIVQDAEGVRIQSLAVYGECAGSEASGVVVDNSGDCQVVDVLLKGFAKYGLQLRNNSFLCEIRGCRSFNSGEAGFCAQKLWENGRGGSFLPNLFSGCVAAGGGVGFAVHQAVVLNLMGCQVFQTAGHGFWLTYESNSVALTGCRTFQVGGDAYHAEEANEISLTGNVFCWQRGSGIFLRKATWGTINGNEIIDSGVRTADGSFRHGVLITGESRGLQVTGNAIFNWADQCPLHIGIEEDDTCYNNNISCNNINYYRKGGLVSKGLNTLTPDNLEAGNWYMWNPAKPYPDFSREPLEAFLKDDWAQSHLLW